MWCEEMSSLLLVGGRNSRVRHLTSTTTTTGPSSVDVTPKRPRKKIMKIKRGSRMPQVDYSSRTSSWSSLSGTNARVCLFPATYQPSKPWDEEEFKSLVNYIRCRRQANTWPATKNTEFWDSAANFITRCNPDHSKRTGNACRNKVLNALRKKFSSPKEAEAYYFPITINEPTSAEVTITPVLITTPVQNSSLDSPSQQLEVLSGIFKSFCRTHSNVDPPDDFLKLALLAMEHLKSCSRSNVVYTLARVLGTMRRDRSDSLLPAKRMPMGLVEYVVNFFGSSTLYESKCPEDYRQWLVTMFSLFGTKFVKLYSGPMWRVESFSREDQISSSRIPSEARTNVPGLSERTLQRDIASSGIETGAGIQTLLLDAAAKANPHATWWIKGDGCDVVPGLCESVQQKWSGDVDLGDGSLQDCYKSYQSKLNFVSGLGLGTRRDKEVIRDDLDTIVNNLRSDKDFVIKELTIANTKYLEKLESNESGSKLLFSAGWKVEELKRLVERSQTLIATVGSITDKVADPEINLVDVNIARYLSKLRDSLHTFIRDLSYHQRVMATHIFVMMISGEQRNIKPYAMPVQCFPYHSITQQQLRRLVSTLVKEMTSRGMNVAGFCSDGEFNAMRNRGYTRPLSIFKIRSDVRSKYARMSKQNLIHMLTPTMTPGGQLVGKVKNPAVGEEILREISQWLSQDLVWSDIISRLRLRTVPAGYTCKPWKSSCKNLKDETETDKLRSILAQMDYKYSVCRYDDQGVPFRMYLHVPEIHPDSGNVFMEREDEGHVLKRIAQCTRNGGPDKLQLQRYTESLHDNEACLTYTALVGSRKQSVQDAERLFSPTLLQFMEKKNYSYEASYIRAVLGWRKACDQRGLSELERCRYNYNMLNFLLDELMPWHTQLYDFSLLEVNRNVNVCGFTREVVIGLVANIETREWRRRDIAQHRSSPENPRSSTTDDVECFFSVMRDQIGLNFTLKQVQFAWRKICLEFKKRISQDLPFYYFTSSHDRFYEGPRPSFDQVNRKKKKERLPRSEQIHSASLTSGRATLPVRGTLTVRPKFHKLPVNIPPPSEIPIHVSEHTY